MNELNAAVLAINFIVIVCFLVSWLYPQPRPVAVMLHILMEKHEENMRSGDPAVVADAVRRWGVLCARLKSRDDTYPLGCDLESWGKSLEKKP